MTCRPIKILPAITRLAAAVSVARLKAVRPSIRINEQYRVCFRWENGHADEVEIADYLIG
jgi:hypothetical protein